MPIDRRCILKMEEEMGQITYTREVKRPNEATPERALALWHSGVTTEEMARMWGISRPYIYHLLHQAGWVKGMER